MNCARSDVKILLCVSVILCLIGCAFEEHAEQEPAAEERAASAGVVRLPVDAQQSIGLETVSTRRVATRATIATTGWLQVRPGDEVVIRAAATGFYVPDSEAPQFALGSSVKRGQRFGSLQVFVSPQEQAQLVAAKEEADTLINQSRVTRELAEAQLSRLKSGPEGIVAGTRLMELEEIARRSRIAEQEARDKLPFLPREPYDQQSDLQPVELSAPIAGRITKVHISPRQLAIQGDPLWTIADWSRLWIRVPVFVGDFPKIVHEATAIVSLPGMTTAVDARPLNVAQPTEPGRRTIDVYYEIDNSAATLRPGQAVDIAVPTGESSKCVVIPSSAIVWDGMGNPWVYVKEGDEQFRRQRVEVQPLPDGAAVYRGLDEGHVVVTVGAQALYGEEFERQIHVEEDGD